MTWCDWCQIKQYTVSDEIVSLIFDEIVKEVEEEGDKNEWLTQSMKKVSMKKYIDVGTTARSAEKQMTQISNENDYINTLGSARPRRTAAHSRCEEIYIWHISTSAMTSININLLKLWLLLILRWRGAHNHNAEEKCECLRKLPTLDLSHWWHWATTITTAKNVYSKYGLGMGSCSIDTNEMKPFVVRFLLFCLVCCVHNFSNLKNPNENIVAVIKWSN